MIEHAQFTNVNGESFTLNDDNAPMDSFIQSVDDRTTERTKAQQHGIWPAYTYLGKRSITMEGNLIGDSSADFLTRRRALKRVFTTRPQYGLRKTGTLAILFTGFGNPLTIDCTTDGGVTCDLTGKNPSISPYQIGLKAFDPRWYGPTRNVTLYAPLGGSGRGFPQTFPQSYVGSGSTSDVIVSNAGDIETYPSVEIHGPCTAPQITLFRNDGGIFTVVLGGLVLTTIHDYVTVDLRYRTAVMNTGLNVYANTINSQWWALEPGDDNTVRYTAATYDATSYALFTWQDAYMM